MRYRFHSLPVAGLTALLAVLLVACSTPSGTQPGRVGFPGESTGTDPALPADPVVSLEDPENDILFAPVRAALADGDWLRAQLALPQPEPARESADPALAQALDAAVFAPTPDIGVHGHPPAVPEDPISDWITYYQARIAWLRGDSEQHEALLSSVEQGAPPALARELLLHRLRIAQAADDAPQAVRLNLALKRLGGHAAYLPAECDQALWTAVQKLDSESSAALRRRADGELHGWLDLASAVRRDAGFEAASALAAWLLQYPQHPARERAERLQGGAVADAGHNQFALLLPLSGPLATAADAVSRGFLAAYYADPNRSMAIDVIDSRRFASIGDAYDAAVARGARVVIGPLGKLQVTEIAAGTDHPVPLLTLNRSSDEFAASDSLQLSLAPEDEAWQLASRAFADGGRRALLIRPEGSWGDRMESALRERWEPLGGKVITAARFGDADTHSQSVRNALALDNSARRAQDLRPLFQERLEAPGRRRGDLDVIFLLSKSSDEARSLKPLIDYHYAGDLPVYAISTADSGSDTAAGNRDLRGLSVLAMPWRLGGEVPGLDSSDSGGSYAALHALGVDAYRVAGRWQRMASGAGLILEGFTATLSTDSGGILRRELKMAQINRGALTPP